MKKFLIIVICFLSVNVLAQELFPELAGIGGRQRTAAQKPAPAQKEVVATQTTENTQQEQKELDDNLPVIAPQEDLTASEQTETEKPETTPAGMGDTAVLFAPKKEEQPQQEEQKEEEEDDPEQRIIVYLEDARATMTPNRNFSYCFGALKFLNTLKRPVLALDLVLKYGDMNAKYSVKNLMPKVEQKGTFNLLGESCEHILDMPEITIKKCQVENMEEKTCKKKFEFVPLRNE